MKAHREPCCQRTRRRREWAAGGLLFAFLAALMPKCPFCVAAWLGGLGLAGLTARVDPRLVWLGGALALGATTAGAVRRLIVRKETPS